MSRLPLELMCTNVFQATVGRKGEDTLMQEGKVMLWTLYEPHFVVDEYSHHQQKITRRSHVGAGARTSLGRAYTITLHLSKPPHVSIP